MMNRLLITALFLLFGAVGVYAQSALTRALVGSIAGADAQTKSKSAQFDVPNEAGIPIRYEVISEADKTVAVTGGKKFYNKLKELTIPATVNNNGVTYTVTEIGEKAFGSMMWGGCMKLGKVVLPSTIVRINDEAFFGCQHLISINLPEGLVEVGEKAFYASALTKLYIPNSVRRIGDKAFDLWTPKDVELENIPLFITTENCKRIGLVQESVQTYLAYHPREAQPAAQPQQQIVYVPTPAQQPAQQSVPQQAGGAAQPKAPSSDVDVDIPQGATGNENTFAVIFANENYQEEVKVEYALNDGMMFKEYCEKVLGLPEDNVHIRKDATLNNIKAEMSWLQQVAKAYKGEARFIVYYAGHGIPDEASGTSYLLPVDGKGTMLETGYSLKDFYRQLGEIPSSGVTVFMDACFSGSKRGDGMLASARGVAIKAKPQAPQGKMVVFSAAQGDETAYPFKEKEHGMFTYYLLKKLKETSGNVSLGELGQYITEQVSRKSIVSNGKSQTPTIVPSGTMTEGWKDMKLR